ncbi:MAG: hypothetical protein U0694_15240 [Anaerolineae bacterium]
MKTRYWLILTLVLLIAAFLTMALSVSADCLPGDIGTAGDDAINCTASNQPGGTADVQGMDGNDTIVIAPEVTAFVSVSGDNTSGVNANGSDVIINDGTINGNILGDSLNGTGSGSDVIINNGYADSIVGDSGGPGTGSDVLVNNGQVVNIMGDSSNMDGSGADSLTNNGNADEIFGDSIYANGSGSDTITNNGALAGDLYADTYQGNGSGNDTVVNNGVIGGSIYGDSELGSGSGSDTIINNGAVNNNIIAGGGDDTVVISGMGYVAGIMDGGAGYDVLTFNLTTSDPEELLAIAAQIAAANPAGGTLTIRGIVYTWQNFEELSALLISLVRLNSYGDPFAVFCALGGGIEVYAVVGNQGVLALSISSQALSNAINFAQANNSLVTVARSANSTLYALATGELQVNAPNGSDYTFSYQTLCGVLPLPRAIAEDIEDEDAFTIINRPR